MSFNKTHWNQIIEIFKQNDYIIVSNEFDEDDLDSCQLIAHADAWSIRIKFDFDNIALDLDDTDSDFGSYYGAIEQMDPVLFAMCFDTILQKLDERY